jgi:hypothetical protein
MVDIREYVYEHKKNNLLMRGYGTVRSGDAIDECGDDGCKVCLESTAR